MSQILQLQISGIRAFDNHDTQYLTFNSPLTLICGQNGVGKTTIIESLRYVTTGDLPPNVKGGAFVHDPRMSSESEVLAQVRLLFTSVNGVKMVATRSMKLTVSRGNKMTFKTLEGFVKEQNTQRDKGTSGGPAKRAASSVTARTADLNMQVPLLLGVPPAILNYVVFCHQEDSLWPFSEPSAVKKKFDDIFEATKYTKALDSLKIVRKEYMNNIRVESRDVEHLQEDKQRASEKETQLQELLDRTEKLRGKTERLQTERVEKSAELDRATEHNQKMQQMQLSVENVKSQISRYSQDAELLKMELTEFIPSSLRSSEDIEHELNSGEQRLRDLEEELNIRTERLRSIQADMLPLNEELAVIDNQQGRVEQLLEVQQIRLKKREELVGSSEVDPQHWRKQQEREMDRLGLDLDSLETVNRKNQLQLSQKISTAEAHQLQLIQIITSMKEAIRECETKRKEAQAQLVKLESSDSLENFKDRLSAMQSRAVELEKESVIALQQFKDFENSKKLQNANEAVSKREKEAEDSREQLARVIDASNRMSQLHHYHARQKEVASKLADAAKKLSELNNVNDEGRQLNASEILKKTEQNLNKLKQEFEAARSNASTLETHLQIERKNFDQAKRRQAAIAYRSKDLLKKHNLTPELIKNINHELSMAENAVLAATEEQEQLSFIHRYYERALKMAQQPEKPCCILCEVEKSPDEAERLVKLLESKISALNITPTEAQNGTELKKKKVEELKALLPHIQSYKQLKAEEDVVSAEIDNLKNKVIYDLETKMAEASIQRDELENEYNQLYENSESLLNTMRRYIAEEHELSTKVEVEEKVMGGTQMEMSLSEAQSHQEECEKKLKQEKSNMQYIKVEYDRFKHRSDTTSQSVKDLKLAISELELTSTRAQQLSDKLAQLQKDQEQHLTAQRKAETEQPEVAADIEQKRKELAQKKFTDSQGEKELVEKRNSYMQTIRQFDDLNKEILDFNKKYGSNPLEKLADKRTACSSKISKLNTEIEVCQESIRKTERIIADFSSFRRNLQDNIKLRKYEAQLAELTTKHTSLQKDLDNERLKFGTSPTELDSKIRDLQDELGGINHSISKMSGELKALQEQIAGLRHELATTYSDTVAKYEKALAQLDSSREASLELAQYTAALDRSIMKYHHMKMDEINDLLDQMWKQTYTGTDIDSIMICSEPGEGSGTTPSVSATSRTSHNYRVCMIKQDTLLDMRGRCSAGQKVLASILIRMALAECFGNSSGLIVLDEPTTNLDVENIEALARSLNEIIGMRRAQPNFQLIVITHDEHFLTQMNPSSYCSSFYKISRDNRQLSVINKLPISSLS